MKALVLCFCGMLWIASSFLSCSGRVRQTEMELFGDSAAVLCQAKYVEARNYQRSQEYDKAIATFKSCFSFDSERESVCDDLVPIMSDALLQLMNTYQSKGDPEGCIAYFRTLPDSSEFIQQYCMRDYYSIFGYALSRTERMEEAEDMIEKALAIPLFNSTPKRLFRDYAYAAAVFYSNPERQEHVEEWCKQAMEQAKLSEDVSGVQWVTSLLGSLYKRMGMLGESIDLLLESVDEAKERDDLLGELNAYNALTSLYLYWNIPDYANFYASMALQKEEELEKENPMIAALTYIMKGQAVQQLGIADSALYYFRKADEYCHSLPYNSGKVDIDFLTGSYMVEHCTGDSLRLGIKALQRVAAEATPANQAKAYHGLALGYLKRGENRLAEVMLDSLYHVLRKSDPPIYIKLNYEPILGHYLDKRDWVNLKNYVDFMFAEHKADVSNDVDTKRIRAIVRFQTEQKERQLLFTRMELENNRLRFFVYFLISVMVVISLLVIFFYRLRIYKARKRLADERLSVLMDNLERSRQHSDRVEQQLSELLTDAKGRKDIEAITPGLLHEKGESKFRQRFEQLYPSFVPTLREKVPSIGRREELLCMLIVLGQDNQQIADLMNIAPRSVHMARHRLRQKMELPKEEALEEIVKAMVKQDTEEE